MDALSRQQYLRAMGIPQWVPRVQLPAAPESPVCELPEGVSIRVRGAAPAAAQARVQAPVQERNTAQPEQAFAPQKSAGGARESAAARISLELDSGSSPRKAPSVKTSQAKPAAPVKERTAVETVRFTLALVRCGEGQLWIAELPEGATEMSVPVRQFIQEVQFALGLVDKSGIHAPLNTQVFQWPMVNIAGIDQGKAEARDALSEVIQASNNQTPVSSVLAFGETAASYLLAAEDSADSITRGKHTLKSLRTDVVVTHAILDAFAKPELKREIWADLQPLRRDV